MNEVLRIPLSGKAAVAPILIKKDNVNFNYHVVKKDDTLFSLSRKYKISIQEIKSVNPELGENLPLNSVVKIPKSPSQPKEQVSNVPQHDKKYYYHVIKAGDTQYSIAKEFQMKQKKLRKLNPKLKRGVLKVGDWVRIPRYLVPPEYFEVKEVVKDTIVEEIVTIDTIPEAEDV
ncbi:LysM peptidoglycan-binding domain-containing protein, partial [Aduncisulcus paluster]